MTIYYVPIIMLVASLELSARKIHDNTLINNC